ncbi:MAG: SpoIIE family protein phosphatase [Bacteroidales bacterium]|nr:SpoIIE family protein phosphatase [Bacteroidales bacterium]
MEVKRDHILSLPIDNNADIGICRRKGANLATQMGFNKVKSGEIAILISELVTNVIKHGGGKGKIVICQIEDNENKKALEVWCCDSGNGISNFQKALQDGYTGKNTLGIGLGTIRRFSDELEINPLSSPIFKETFFSKNYTFKYCVRSLKWLPSKSWTGLNNNLNIGAASRCKPGEQLNGDSYVINHISPEISVVAVIDGLGHGKEANIASALAKEQILLKPDLPLDSLMKHIHNSIRGTRGTVLGLARINTKINKLYFSGVGNIESFIIAENGKKTLLSFGGIMGHNMRTPKIFEFDFKPDNILCMYSDGITTRWKPEDLDWNEPPQKNSEYILNNYSRQNDDATILIIRNAS